MVPVVAVVIPQKNFDMIPKRKKPNEIQWLIFFVCVGTMVSYMLRVSLNIAIVTMTDIEGDNNTKNFCIQNATDDDQR